LVSANRSASRQARLPGDIHIRHDDTSYAHPSINACAIAASNTNANTPCVTAPAHVAAWSLERDECHRFHQWHGVQRNAQKWQDNTEQEEHCF
jgi:hypothetical protein